MCCTIKRTPGTRVVKLFFSNASRSSNGDREAIQGAQAYRPRFFDELMTGMCLAEEDVEDEEMPLMCLLEIFDDDGFRSLSMREALRGGERSRDEETFSEGGGDLSERLEIDE